MNLNNRRSIAENQEGTFSLGFFMLEGKEIQKKRLIMIVYVYLKCSTCQKALTFLQQKNVNFTCKEITETPPSLAELQTMLKYVQGNVKKLFNVSGQLYREMQLAEKLQKMSEIEALALLSQHGMLVKRPFLLSEDFGWVGFREEEWALRL